MTRSTLIFFFSDNGGPVSVTNCRNTPLRGAKGQVYEGGIRVPFVMSWPKAIQPGTVATPVSSLDVFPTACAAASAAMSNKATLDGNNLLPALRDKGVPAERALFWRTGGGQSFAVRLGSWKLVRNGINSPELYNLASYVSESKNLAETEPAFVERLTKQVNDWNAGLVPPHWQNQTPAKKK